MIFEFDPEKSESNKAKHGIDFEEAQGLWKDEDLSLISARDEGVRRFMLIGKTATKYWSVVYTNRDSKVRIISVRRSRDKEIEL